MIETDRKGRMNINTLNLSCVIMLSMVHCNSVKDSDQEVSNTKLALVWEAMHSR